jgi:hypothetical protein
MASKKTKEECQEVNKRMHTLIGYCEEDWNQHSMSEFQIALDKIEKFQVIFAPNFIAMHCEQQILEFKRVAFDLPAVSSLRRDWLRV